MIVSAAEYRDAIKKAGRGAGLEASFALDLAAACCLLSMAGYNGSQGALACLQKLSAPHPPQRLSENRLVWSEGRAALEGVQAIEMMQGGLAKTVQFDQLDVPAVLIALASYLAPEMAFACLHDERVIGQCGGGQLELLDSQPAAGPAGPVQLVQLEQMPDIARTPLMPFGVDPKDWQVIGQLAARIYVPESDLSRTSGAGAGEIDND